MKHVLSRSLVAVTLLLSACGPTTSATHDPLQNPLYADQFYSDMVERLVTMQLRNEAPAKDPAIKKLVDKERVDGVAKVHEAAALKSQGLIGRLQSETEDAQGQTLLLNNRLFVGTDFLATPGRNAHVYLTTTVDPRDGTFPDPTAVDLGLVQRAYGAQAWDLPARTGTGTLRTMVIYDANLKWLLGFAQLHGN